MSHNLYTLNNTGGNVLSYHTASRGVLYFGKGTTVAYPASVTSGATFEWYAPASERVNTIGATFGTGSGTGWVNSITLPAGTYEIYSYVLIPTGVTSAGYQGLSALIAYENSVAYGNMYIYNLSTTGANGRRDLPSFTHKTIRTYTTSTTLTYAFTLAAGATISDAGNRISDTQFFFVRKLL